MKTEIFQGIECVKGYKELSTIDKVITPPYNWYNTKILQTRYHHNNYVNKIVLYEDIKIVGNFGNNIYEYYMPKKSIISTHCNNTIVSGTCFYVGDMVQETSRTTPISSLPLGWTWDTLNNTQKENVITHDKNFDIEKHWDKLTYEQICKVCIYQLHNFNISKHWSLLSYQHMQDVACNQIYNFDVEKHWFNLGLRDIICKYQIINFNVEKHWKELSQSQIDCVCEYQAHKINVKKRWNKLSCRQKEILSSHYIKKENVDYKKDSFGEWVAELSCLSHGVISSWGNSFADTGTFAPINISKVVPSSLFGGVGASLCPCNQTAFTATTSEPFDISSISSLLDEEIYSRLAVSEKYIIPPFKSSPIKTLYSS